MKKCLLFFAFAYSVSIYAQDIIVKKDGSTILSKVLEINTSDVKYKKSSNLNGPIYTIKISEIMSINYENGEKDDFRNSNSLLETKEDALSQNFVRKPADKRNVELIDMYNNVYSPKKNLKNRNKKANSYILFFGVEPSSIMSNDEIEIQLVRTDMNIFGFETLAYNINIKNKTNRTIYIDKGNCFKIFADGKSFCYYNSTKQITVSKGSGNGSSLSLGSVAGVIGVGGALGQIAGGVTVGQSSSRSVSTTFSQERIVRIPPYSNKNLIDENYVEMKSLHFGSGKAVYQTFEYAESFDYDLLRASEIGWLGGNNKAIQDDRIYFDPLLPLNLVKIGESIIYDEKNTPFKQKYIITYSTEEDFRTYSSLQADIYLHQVIGVDKYRKKNNLISIPRLLDLDCIDGIKSYTIEGFYSPM